MFSAARRPPVPDPFGAAEFAAATNVSRETLERLTIYADLLQKWGSQVNLVGRSTLVDLWRRHMLDSAQIWPHIPPTAETLVDFGSGAGFPGLVLAIMGMRDVHLIESNTRKCTFLREVARHTATSVTIHNSRIEDRAVVKADVVTARALAPLHLLFEYAQPYLKPTSVCLFLKGRGVDEELTELRKMWNISQNAYRSITDPEAVILRLEAKPHGTTC